MPRIFEAGRRAALEKMPEIRQVLGHDPTENLAA
jgi:hypothetical protein